jgi:glycosyltransferase involved in cell wall biosynthesis
MSERFTALFQPALRVIERLYLAHAENRIYVCDWIRRHLEDKGGPPARRSFTIHNGVDPDSFSSEGSQPKPQKDADHDAPVILFSGRLIALKGLHTLLKALVHLAHDGIKPVLLIAGHGDARPWIQLAKRLDVVSQCRFLGHVDGASMPQLYLKASIFVLPSFMESCPFGMLEAMAAGRPVVASLVGGIPEVITSGEHGFLVTAGDAEGLAAAIRQLLEDDSLRTRLGNNGQRRVKRRFSAKRMAEKTLDAYEAILGGS